MGWKRFLIPATPSAPEPGIRHYRIERPDRHSRIHLRTEPDGSGLMLVDASVAVRLNQSGLEVARCILEGKGLAETRRALGKVFRGIDVNQLARDYARLEQIIHHVAEPGGECPWQELMSPEDEPFSFEVSAPYRADLALTYRCQNDCPHCYVERDKEMPSLSAQQWRTVLENLWDAGVPHVCFTGGEATLCDSLPELVEAAEDLGQITGLLTNGRRLADRDYARLLLGAGLDHVQITVESHLEEIHNQMVGADGHAETLAGLKNMLSEEVYVVTNTTLTKLNAPEIEATVEFLHDMGVRTFACNSLIYSGGAKESDVGLTIEELALALPLVRERAVSLGMRFIWYTPTPYCRMNPAEMGLGFKRCTAAEYNICIEPNGDVLPCQSCFQTAGNILEDKWEAIWNGEVFREIRERLAVPDDCRSCPDFAVCGSGCPLSREHDLVCCTDRVSEG